MGHLYPSLFFILQNENINKFLYQKTCRNTFFGTFVCKKKFHLKYLLFCTVWMTNYYFDINNYYVNNGHYYVPRV